MILLDKFYDFLIVYHPLSLFFEQQQFQIPHKSTNYHSKQPKSTHLAPSLVLMHPYLGKIHSTTRGIQITV